jgi:hypothetical protein
VAAVWMGVAMAVVQVSRGVVSLIQAQMLTKWLAMLRISILILNPMFTLLVIYTKHHQETNELKAKIRT